MSFANLAPLINLLRKALTLVFILLTCSLPLFIPLAYLFSQCSTGEALNEIAKPIPENYLKENVPHTPENSLNKQLQTRMANAQTENLQLKLNSALTSFTLANLQQISIFSQSTADPKYNTPQQLLSYPGGAWEFEFLCNKKAQLFIYRDAMDTDYLLLYKKGNTLWSQNSNAKLADLVAPPGKNWSKVKSSLLTQEPYNYTQVKSLDQLPFLFLHSQMKITDPVVKTQLNGQECYILKVQPQLPQNNWQAKSSLQTPELPKEISLWITCKDTPRLTKAQYFWVSHPPGGTMYTVNLVTFKQK